MSNTNDYYNSNSQTFFESTIQADLSHLYERFLQYVPDQGKILDLGCGSGRDVKAFKDLGYVVDAMDASEELVKLATAHTGIQVRQQRFEDLTEQNGYDAVWACASLLHVEYDKLPDILTKINRALKKNGIFYMSFKLGDHDGQRDGRYFTDMNDDRFNKLNTDQIGFTTVDKWRTRDARPDRDVEWFNVILKKSAKGELLC